jgi:hypothetical protein
MTKFKLVVVIALVAAGLVAWLHWNVMPNFIAGRVSNDAVIVGDYYLAHIREDNTPENVMKLEQGRLGWGAVRESWPAMIPALLIGLPVAWFLGRILLDDEHNTRANEDIERNNRLMTEREKTADAKCARAEKLKADAEASEHETYQVWERARQMLRKAEAMKQAAQEQIVSANGRADEAERKLEKEREEHKKMHAQLVRYKEKARGQRDPQMDTPH